MQWLLPNHGCTCLSINAVGAVAVRIVGVVRRAGSWTTVTANVHEL